MTIDEVAKLAGVSITTVRDVINGTAKLNGISVETQKRVMAVVEECHYHPIDSDLEHGADGSRAIGIIIPNIENCSYALFIKLLEKLARAKGYSIVIACSDDDPKTEKMAVNALVSRRIDALIVATALHDGTDFYKEIQASGTPIIAIDRSMDDEFFSCVISEDFDAAFALTNSVISPSVSSIGLIGAIPELSVSRERQLGFEYAVKKKGIRSVVSYGQAFSREEGSRLFSEWVTQGCLPDSIVCTSYNLLEGILDVLLERDDLVSMVRLATFGENRLLDFLPFPINSAPQQHEQMARSTLTFALKASEPDFQSEVELIPRLIIVRKK
jgi:LacI family fructose operon transcriptional repressor